jgi:hypothetical protein
MKLTLAAAFAIMFALAVPAFGALAVEPQEQPVCAFSRGVSTCTSETTSIETTTRTVFSGCVAGPTGVPGRRTTVFEDTVQVTTMTTTMAHGRQGPVFSSDVSESRELLASREVSSVCEAL